MFYGCKSLKKLEISALKTDEVTDMKYMFYGCSSLKEIDLYNLNNKKCYYYGKLI